MTPTLHSAFGVTSPKGDTRKIPLDAVIRLGSHTDVEPDPTFVFEYRALRRVLKNIGTQTPLWIWGPSGCGKTQLIIEIGARIRRPVHLISFGEETSLRELTGSFVLDNEGEGTRTRFCYGQLARAIRDPLAIVVLDELNMAPPGVAAQLNRVIEAGSLVIPETGESIQAAEGVTFVATANTAGSQDESGVYAGSQLQNGATRNRFAGLKLGYLSPDLEQGMLLRAFPELDRTVPIQHENKAFSVLAVELAGGLRALVHNGAVGLPFSVRSLKRFVESTLSLGDVRDGFADAWLDLLPPSEAVPAGEVFHRVLGIRMEG